MVDVSNFKINERSNVERSNLRESVTKIGNRNWEVKVWKLAKLRVERNIEWMNISKMYQFFWISCFPNWKNSKNLLIFQFETFQKFPIQKIPKNFYNCLIWEMFKFSNFFNLKNYQIFWVFNQFRKNVLKNKNIE